MAYRNSRTRAVAAARAVKMMKLFNAGCFEAIMEAVDPPPIKEPAFTIACQNCGLVQSEVVWLKAYLSQCSAALYGPIPDAAATGW